MHAALSPCTCTTTTALIWPSESRIKSIRPLDWEEDLPTALNADVSSTNTSVEGLAFGVLTANTCRRGRTEKTDAHLSTSCRLSVLMEDYFILQRIQEPLHFQLS